MIWIAFLRTWLGTAGLGGYCGRVREGMVRTGAQAVSGQVSLPPSLLVSSETIFIQPELSNLLYPHPSLPALTHRIHSHYHPCHPPILVPPPTSSLIHNLPTQHHGRREHPKPKRASQEVSEPISKYASLLGSFNLSTTRAFTHSNTVLSELV